METKLNNKNCYICKDENVVMALDSRKRVLKMCVKCYEKRNGKCCKCQKVINGLKNSKGKEARICNECLLIQMNTRKEKITYENSFSCHKKSEFFNMKKNNINPKDIALNSHTNYWFNCPECKHEFKTSPQVINRDHWCPFCGSKDLCKNLDCTFCFEKSFDSCKRKEDWIIEINKISPRFVFLNSAVKYWFNCKECKHNFEASPCYINANKTWCPYCGVKIYVKI